MLSGIEIVEHNIDDLVLLEHKSMRIYAINLRLRCVHASGEGSEESGYFWSYVGYSVEESTDIDKLLRHVRAVANVLIRSVSKVVHDHIQSDSLISVGQEFHAVKWNECEVVMWLESIN